jgi:lipid A 3-O-deacylase
MRERAMVMALAIAAAAFLPAVARADRLTLLEENDSLYFHSDKHYTQGLRIDDLSPALAPDSGWNAPFDFLARHSPVFAGPYAARRYALFFGQSIFTPKNLTLRPPDPHDRPYAGWLYGGASLMQDEAGGLENVELDLGIVGPGALGKEVQNNWHQFIGIAPARGWSSQLQNEPGAVLAYERLWRLAVVGDGARGVDVVPQLGAVAGNVFTYGEAGALLRFGGDLLADYGPSRVRPALSGTDYFDDGEAAAGPDGYFYLGAQGRVVGRNVFLDGNSFRTSPSIAKKILVGDLQAGVALFWSAAVQLDFSVVLRSEEFVGQRTPDTIGTAAIAFAW